MAAICSGSCILSSVARARRQPRWAWRPWRLVAPRISHMARAAICADISRLHAEVPLISLLGLVHLGVALAFGVPLLLLWKEN